MKLLVTVRFFFIMFFAIGLNATDRANDQDVLVILNGDEQFSFHADELVNIILARGPNANNKTLRDAIFAGENYEKISLKLRQAAEKKLLGVVRKLILDPKDSAQCDAMQLALEETKFVFIFSTELYLAATNLSRMFAPINLEHTSKLLAWAMIIDNRTDDILTGNYNFYLGIASDCHAAEMQTLLNCTKACQAHTDIFDSKAVIARLKNQQ